MKKLSIVITAIAISGTFGFAMANNHDISTVKAVNVHSALTDTIPGQQKSKKGSTSPSDPVTPNPVPNPNSTPNPVPNSNPTPGSPSYTNPTPAPLPNPAPNPGVNPTPSPTPGSTPSTPPSSTPSTSPGSTPPSSTPGGMSPTP